MSIYIIFEKKNQYNNHSCKNIDFYIIKNGTDILIIIELEYNHLKDFIYHFIYNYFRERMLQIKQGI